MDSLKVKITGPHTHGGRFIPEGEVIEVPARLARLMCSVWKTAVPFEWPEPDQGKKSRKKTRAKS